MYNNVNNNVLAALTNVCYGNERKTAEDCLMRITELYSDVIVEDRKYEYKAVLNPDNPVKWAKSLVGFANGDGGILFVGVSNDGEAFGIDLRDIDRMKNLVATVNDRYIFPRVRISYMIRSVDEAAEHHRILSCVTVKVILMRRFISRETAILLRPHQKKLYLYQNENMVLITKAVMFCMRKRGGLRI